MTRRVIKHMQNYILDNTKQLASTGKTSFQNLRIVYLF